MNIDSKQVNKMINRSIFKMAGSCDVNGDLVNNVDNSTKSLLQEMETVFDNFKNGTATCYIKTGAKDKKFLCVEVQADIGEQQYEFKYSL